MGITVYFDTYAFYELIMGNEAYKEFRTGYAIITTKMNLMELFYGLILKFNEEIADRYYDQFIQCTVDIDDKTIKEAMHFRKKYKDRKLSYIDCLGYTISLKMGVPFVTGDQQFQDMINVRFIK